MKFNSIKEITLFEHRFWLQVLGDHSRFILNALSPKETSFIPGAKQFINIFDSLLEKSRRVVSGEELAELNCQAYSAAMRIKDFKLIILTRHIEEKINISLPPTFINHMLNELDEYIFILNALMTGKITSERDLHLHLLWLPDGSGHASALASNLDETEKKLIKESGEYSKMFADMYLRAIEYNGYTRTGICEFPALRKLDMDADETMSCFKMFLEEIKKGVIEKKVLGTLSPLMADHMSREECYYLTKLSMAAGTKDPECDPAKPRIEA